MFDAIRDVGLKCDGVTDDTPALRAFLAAHPGPLVIQWPECVCCIGKLEITRPGVRFVGQGVGTPFGTSPGAFTTFKYSGRPSPFDHDSFVLRFAGPVSRCEMDGIAIDAAGAGVGLWLRSASFCRFPSVSVSNASQWAMVIDIAGDGYLADSSSRDNYFGHLQLFGRNGLKLCAPRVALDPCSNYFGRVDILYDGGPGTRGLLFDWTDSNYFGMVNVGECQPGTEPGVTFGDTWQIVISELICPRSVELAPVTEFGKLYSAKYGNLINGLAIGEQGGKLIDTGLAIIATSGETWNLRPYAANDVRKV